MAAATKPVQRVYEIGDLNAFPMTATSKIYQGTAVGQAAAGTAARALVATDKFHGFAIDTYDNSAGAAGDVDVVVKTFGYVELTVVGLAATTPVGTSVYASDDSTFTLTSTSNSLIGKVHRVLPGAVKAIVCFDADVI